MTTIGTGIAFERGGAIGHGHILQSVPRENEKSRCHSQRSFEHRVAHFTLRFYDSSHLFGIDPVWYGVIFISALAVGQATPPVGVNLFTAANLIKSDVDAIAKEAIIYVVMDIVIIVILSLLPILSLYLPIKFGLYSP